MTSTSYNGVFTLSMGAESYAAWLADQRRAVAFSAELGIGLVFRRLSLNEEAVFWLEKCVVAHSSPAATVALAQTCLQLTSAAGGIATLKRVIDQVGEDHTLMMTLGQLYLSSGRTAEGNAILRKALECA